MKSLSRVRLLATPWTAAYQAPPSMGFSREEYWSGVPLYPLGNQKKSNMICFVAIFTSLWWSGTCSISEVCLHSRSFKAGRSPNPALSREAVFSHSSVSSQSP